MTSSYRRYRDLRTAFFSASDYLGRFVDAAHLSDKTTEGLLKIVWDGKGAPVVANRFTMDDVPAGQKPLSYDGRGLIYLAVDQGEGGRLTAEGRRYARENGLEQSFEALLAVTANRADVAAAVCDRRMFLQFRRVASEEMLQSQARSTRPGTDTAWGLVVQIVKPLPPVAPRVMKKSGFKYN